VLTELIRAVKALRSRKGAGSVACSEKASGAKLCSPAERQSKTHTRPKLDCLNPSPVGSIEGRHATQPNACLLRRCTSNSSGCIHRMAQASLLSGGLGRNGSLKVSNLSLAWNMGSPKQAGWPARRRSPRSTPRARLMAGAVQRHRGRAHKAAAMLPNTPCRGGRGTATTYPKTRK
jgi:hypothetical protein